MTQATLSAMKVLRFTDGYRAIFLLLTNQNCIVIHPTTAKQELQQAGKFGAVQPDDKSSFPPQAGTSAILYTQLQVMQQIPTHGEISARHLQIFHDRKKNQPKNGGRGEK